MNEAFQPIAIRPPSESQALFALRCVFDLQLLTTYRFLRRELIQCRGRFVDVGAGQLPWHELAPGCTGSRCFGWRNVVPRCLYWLTNWSCRPLRYCGRVVGSKDFGPGRWRSPWVSSVQAS